MSNLERFIERRLGELTDERDKLQAENERLTKALDEKQKSFCTHCKTMFPKGQEGFEQFKKHIADCPSHPLAAISQQKKHIFSLAKRVHARAVAAESKVDRLTAENQRLRDRGKAMYEAGDELLGHIEGGFLLYIGGRECDELAEFRDSLVNWPPAQAQTTVQVADEDGEAQ